MNPSWVVGTLILALIEGALVALPRADALGRLSTTPIPALDCRTSGVDRGRHVCAAGNSIARSRVVALGALATLPLVAVAVLWVVRGPRLALIWVSLAAGLGYLASGWGAQLSMTALTAAGCLAVGTTLAQLIPARGMLTGILSMCVLDIAFLASGTGQVAGSLLAQAAGHMHGPVLGQAQVGSAGIDYPDLVLAAVFGGFLAGQPRQRRDARRGPFRGLLLAGAGERRHLAGDGSRRRDGGWPPRHPGAA